MDASVILKQIDDLVAKRNEAQEARKKLEAAASDPQFASVVAAVVQADDAQAIQQTKAVEAGLANFRDLLFKALGVIGAAALLVPLLLLLFVLPGSSGSAMDAPGLISVTTLVLVIFAGGLLLMSGLGGSSRFETFWRNVEAVFGSGVFYFFAGLLLLLYAFHTSNAREHPSLTFLIAMLGFAITLYGTGSRAAGAIATSGARLPGATEANGQSSAGVDDASASAAVVAKAKAVKAAVDEGIGKPTDAEKAAALTAIQTLAADAVTSAEAVNTAPPGSPPVAANDWTPFKANAAVAGGAAVLTMLFGAGVIYSSQKIREVFSDYDRYMYVLVDACASFSGCGSTSRVEGFNLDEYSVKAALFDGTSVPLIKDATSMKLILFQPTVTTGQRVRLDVRRIQGSERQDVSNSMVVWLTVGANLVTPGKVDSADPDVVCTSAEQTSDCQIAHFSGRLPVGRVEGGKYYANFIKGTRGNEIARTVTAVADKSGEVLSQPTVVLK